MYALNLVDQEDLDLQRRKLRAEAALPASFPSDVPRPEAPAAAVKGFFVDCWRVVREREAFGTVLGLALFQAIVTAGGGVLLARALHEGSRAQ